MSTELRFVSKKESETLQQLKERGEKERLEKRNAYWELNKQIVKADGFKKKPKKPFYLYPDSRETFNLVTPEIILSKLKAGSWAWVLEVAGIIVNYKRIMGNLTQDQQASLDFIEAMLELAMKKSKKTQ